MEIIEKAFNSMFKSYKKMFETHIPRINDGALPEANQTYYFCQNLVKELNNGAEASLEVPIILKGRKKRVDGIVVSPSTNQIFYIEAKRLKAGNEATRQLIYKDIYKVLDANRKEFVKEYINFNCEYEEVKEYIVILADLWIEGNYKNRNEIPFWWCGNDNSKLSDFNIEKFGNPKSTFIKGILQDDSKGTPLRKSISSKDELGWINKNQYIKRFTNYKSHKEKKYLQNYCLLVGSAKLPAKLE